MRYPEKKNNKKIFIHIQVFDCYCTQCIRLRSASKLIFRVNDPTLHYSVDTPSLCLNCEIMESVNGQWKVYVRNFLARAKGKLYLWIYYYIISSINTTISWNSNIGQYIWLHVSAYLILSNLQAYRIQNSDM